MYHYNNNDTFFFLFQKTIILDRWETSCSLFTGHHKSSCSKYKMSLKEESLSYSLKADNTQTQFRIMTSIHNITLQTGYCNEMTAIFWRRVNCQHLAPLCKNAASACLIFCDFSVLTWGTVMSGSLSSAGSSIFSVQVSKMSLPRNTHRLCKTQQLLTIVGIHKMLTPIFFNRHIPQSY